MKASEPPIVTTEVFNVPATRVWSAITDLNEMTQWFFENIDAFEPVVGSRSQFVVDTGERQFTHTWEVTEVILNSKIVYSWHYPEYPGDAYVRFELFGNGNVTELKLTMMVVEDFPDEIPEFQRESCQGGWHYFINERLKAYLA